MHKVIQASLGVLATSLLISGSAPAQANHAQNPAKQSAAQASRQQHLAEIFKSLEKASWIAEGKGSRIVYIFFDPNCPYCHRVYEALRTRVGKNDLEVRWIPVGILMTTSFGKAAAILEAQDPLAAFRENEEKFVATADAFGAAKETFASAETEMRLNQDAKLLMQIGGQSVPTLVFRDAAGQVHVAQGAPSPQKLDALLALVR